MLMGVKTQEFGVNGFPLYFDHRPVPEIQHDGTPTLRVSASLGGVKKQTRKRRLGLCIVVLVPLWHPPPPPLLLLNSRRRLRLLLHGR